MTFTATNSNLLKYAALPVSMTAMLLCIYSTPSYGIKIEIAILIFSIINFFIVCLWEKFIPYRKEWQSKDEERGNDIGHLFFGTALGGFIGKEATQVLVGLSAIFFMKVFNTQSFWPNSLPIFMDYVLVFLIADLGRYAQHRAHHRFDFLWNFHVLHHATNRIWAIKSSRSNIVERILQQIALYAPLAILGAPLEAVTFFVAFNSLLGPYSHSNSDLKLGYLNYIFMGPEVHRIHHGKFIESRNSNFGSALVIWDIVFRTYSSPSSKPKYFEVGDDGKFKENGFFKQAFFPILKTK